MKKLVALLCTAAMGLSLVACSTPAKTTETTAAAEKPAATETAQGTQAKGNLKVGVFYYNFADNYISTVRSALDEKLKAAGVEFQNFDGANQQPLQSDSITTALTQGYNMLVVNIVETDSDAAQQVVNAAKEKGIPVVFFNREVQKSVIQSYENAAFVGTNAPEAGHLQGKMIGEYLVANFDKVDVNGDGQISYAMFKGQDGNPEAEARTQFAVEDANKVLEAAGKKPLAFYDPKAKDFFQTDPNGAWSAQAGQDYMSTILATYNEANKNMVEIVIANNDDMALGAINALATAGYNKAGSDKLVPVFGVDATDIAKAAIKEGTMTGTIKQDADGMAAGLAHLVQNIQKGGKLMDDTSKMQVDSDAAMIRIPYQIWTKDSK